MNTVRPLLIVAIVSLAVSACEQAESDVTSPPYSAAVAQALEGIEFSRAPGLPMETLQRRVDVAVDAMYEVSARATTWQEAHALAQQQIRDAEPGVVRATVEQAMAKLMLVGYLAPHAQDPGTADLALSYAQSLVEQGSPEAEAVLETAEAFGPAWDAADLRAVARGAAEAVEAHVQGGSGCSSCDLPVEARRRLAETGQQTDVVSVRRLDAARQLRALAEASV